VIGPYEFDPRKAPATNGVFRLEAAMVDRALRPAAAGSQSATSAAGWDASGAVPWADIKNE